MALETAYIQDKLAQAFGNNVLNFEMKRDIFTLEATPSTIHEVIRFLKEQEDLNLFIPSDEWTLYLTNKEEWKKQLPKLASRKAMEEKSKK